MSSRFNTHDPAFLQNPYPTYDRLRAASPIFFDQESGLWICTAHEDVDFLLRDRRLGRAIDPAILPADKRPQPRPPEYLPFTSLGANSMFDKEPPDHTRLKTLVHKVFTPRRTYRLRDEIQAITGTLLDAAQEAGEVDLLEEFATPLPVAVIAELLGVPPADRSSVTAVVAGHRGHV